MANVVLGNAFSLQMLDLSRVYHVRIIPLTLDEVRDLLQNGFVSAVGHNDTANVLSNLLGVDVQMNRVNVSLDNNTVLVVAQLTGGRLPEGATTLPEGFSFTFVRVELI